MSHSLPLGTKHLVRGRGRRCARRAPGL